MSRKPKEGTVTVTIRKVPHPNPQGAVDLVAKLVIKNFWDELEQVRTGQAVSIRADNRQSAVN